MVMNLLWWMYKKIQAVLEMIIEINLFVLHSVIYKFAQTSLV